MSKNDLELYKKFKGNAFLFEIYKKVHYKHENVLIVITGKVQKGKSTVARKILSWIDPNFNASRIVWNPTQFIKDLLDNLKRGDGINFEEIGTESGGVNRRKWYSFNNMVINDILQTFGHEGLIVVFTVPTTDFIDKMSFKLINYEVRVIEKDLNKKINICKINRIEYNDRNKEFYYHKIKDPFSKRKRMNFIFEAPTDQKLEKEYREKEIEFKKGLQKEIYKRINEKIDPVDTVQKYYDIAIKDLSPFLRFKGGKPYIHKASLEDEFDIGDRLSDRLKRKIEKFMKENEGRGAIYVST